jgi:Predicted transcriptional regulator
MTMSIELKVIGGRIKEIRGRLSLADFEKILGVSRSSISLYERGEAWPKPETLAKIVEHGRVTYDWLFTGKEPEFIPPEKPPIPCPLGEKEEKAIRGAQDLLEHYGLGNRFAVIPIPAPQEEHLADDEKQLLKSYRQLDGRRKARLVEDAEDFALAVRESLEKGSTESNLKGQKSA